MHDLPYISAGNKLRRCWEFAALHLSWSRDDSIVLSGLKLRDVAWRQSSDTAGWMSPAAAAAAAAAAAGAVTHYK